MDGIMAAIVTCGTVSMYIAVRCVDSAGIIGTIDSHFAGRKTQKMISIGEPAFEPAAHAI